eukprot:767818-Hanusia_phi.AAC.6
MVNNQGIANLKSRCSKLDGDERLKMADVQTKLDAKKAEFNIRMSKCKEKEELLAMKQSKLKLESENYKLFLQEFNAKRERAEKRAKEEIQIRKAKEEEIEILKEELKNLRKRLDEAKKKLEGGLMYQNYLESVVDFGEDFGEIEDSGHYTILCCPSLRIGLVTKKRYPMLVFTSQELKVILCELPAGGSLTADEGGCRCKYGGGGSCTSIWRRTSAKALMHMFATGKTRTTLQGDAEQSEIPLYRA